MKGIWIIEANYEKHNRKMIGWHPTVGIGLTKTDAERALRDWKKRNPDDWFRVVRYLRAAQ